MTKEHIMKENERLLSKIDEGLHAAIDLVPKDSALHYLLEDLHSDIHDLSFNVIQKTHKLISRTKDA